MAKPEQILTVEPANELKFKGPFTSPVTSYIKLTNPSDNKVCFKIKTTAPKRYCVRPNSGILNPQSFVEIAVSLQPFDFDANERNKHKFMVQSIIAPAAEDFNLDALWKEASSEILMDSKLKCVFEMPSDEVPPSAPMFLLNRDDLKKRNTVSSINSADSTESEIQKANNEILRLREELSSTQRENLQLKEDLLKAIHPNQQLQSTFSRKTNQQTYASESTQITPVIYLACGVVVGLLSMLLGKYIF